MIHGSHSKQKLAGACASPVLLCLLLTSTHVLAQSSNQLDRLVFDPVLIDPETGSQQRPALSLPLQFLPLESTTNREPLEPADIAEFSPLEIIRNIEAYEKSVNELEAQDGPFASDLYEALIDLASQHKLARDFEAAIEVLERAEHISRVNNGLYHPEQFTSIEMMIDTYLDMGDIASANEKQRYLVYLSEQYYGRADPNTLPSLVDLAEQNMENFNRVMTMPEVPTISFSYSSGIGPSRRDPTQREMAFGSLFMAQQNYMRAISNMLSNRQFFDPMLLDLEYNFLETLFLQAFRTAILEDADFYLSNRRNLTGSLIKHDSNRRAMYGYNNGKDTFERILIYIRNNPEAKVYQLVNALMEYGDWNMLFGKTQSAQEKYREAYALVAELGVEAQAVELLFRPDLPVHLPLITPKPNSREKFGIADNTDLDHAGYIDIAFTISRFGRAKRFDILDTSGEVTREVESRLKRYLRNSPFRPRLNTDDKFVAHRVTLRYYFSYADQQLLATGY